MDRKLVIYWVFLHCVALNRSGTFTSDTGTEGDDGSESGDFYFVVFTLQ